jgi:hypothetical protein
MIVYSVKRIRPLKVKHKLGSFYCDRPKSLFSRGTKKVLQFDFNSLGGAISSESRTKTRKSSPLQKTSVMFWGHTKDEIP